MLSYSKLLTIPPTFPRKSVIMLVLLKFALLGMLAYFAWDSYLEVGSSRKCLRLAELTGTIDNIDETLTMSVQMAAVTGDKKWEERYLNFEPKLNSTIKEALEVAMYSKCKDYDEEHPEYKEALEVNYEDWKKEKYYCHFCRTIVKHGENCMCIVDRT